MSRRAALLCLALSLLVAACARQDRGADDNRTGGFYGGVIGGISRP